jgi:uncharacterized protein YoxC
MGESIKKKGMIFMRKSVRRVTAGVLTMVMLSLSPLVDMMPKSADTAKAATLYISEVKVGMGETANEAGKELEEEGYTILKDSSGNYADLNEEAGSKSALKRGANDKIVYLGYKTTEDPGEAITDLAVMNMEGGFSIEDYNILMNNQMESVIKPFTERFISTLNEYRENYNKPENSLGHIRADYMRRMLNRMTDDDTGGQPIGDLLLNKTRYEMKEEEYNSLSDEEKNKHADILTMLMQANGQATLSIETLLTKATDPGDDTWIDRFRETTTEDLITRIKEEDPSLTTRGDVMAALDRRYYDIASGLLKKWRAFNNDVTDYEEKVDYLADSVDDTTEMIEDIKDIDIIEASEDEREELIEANADATKQMKDAQKVAVTAYLETIEYGDGTLLDFFSQDYSEVSGTEGIRKLYPIADALTAGQIAGLEFLSFDDLFALALADKDTYKDVNNMAEDVKTASVYEGVDRGIYEQGGVALTNDALRAKASEAQKKPDGYTPGTLQTVLWISTGCLAAATLVSNVVRQVMLSKIPQIARQYQAIWNNTDALQKTRTNIIESMYKWTNENTSKLTTQQIHGKWHETEELLDTMRERQSDLENATGDSVYYTGNFSKYLSIGLAVLTVVMTVFSTVMTLLDAADYYDTEYIPIPKYIVEEADITAYDDNNEKIMIKNQTAYYKAVTCNRKEGDSKITRRNYDVMEDRADLNGDIGRQWLALYAVKYEHGNPILADSLLYQKGDGNMPKGYSTGIHEFGSKAAFNLNYKHYLFPDNPPSIRVFFKNEARSIEPASVSGTIFSEGALVTGTVGLVAGGLIGALVVWFISRRKKSVQVN